MFDKFRIKKLMTGNGNYVHLQNVAWKHLWNHYKWTYFWQVLLDWNAVPLPTVKFAKLLKNTVVLKNLRHHKINIFDRNHFQKDSNDIQLSLKIKIFQSLVAMLIIDLILVSQIKICFWSRIKVVLTETPHCPKIWGGGSSNIAGIICPLGPNRVNWYPKTWGGGTCPPCTPTSGVSDLGSNSKTVIQILN